MGHLDLEGSDFRSQDFLSDTEAEELEIWGTKEEVGGRAGWNTWSVVAVQSELSQGQGPTWGWFAAQNEEVGETDGHHGEAQSDVPALRSAPNFTITSMSSNSLTVHSYSSTCV